MSNDQEEERKSLQGDKSGLGRGLCLPLDKAEYKEEKIVEMELLNVSEIVK